MTRTTKRQNTYQRKLTIHKNGPNKLQHTQKTTLRERKTEPGLVAFYDIQPGNGASPFLQPRSPHGAGVTTLTGPKRSSDRTGEWLLIVHV